MVGVHKKNTRYSFFYSNCNIPQWILGKKYNSFGTNPIGHNSITALWVRS